MGCSVSLALLGTKTAAAATSLMHPSRLSHMCVMVLKPVRSLSPSWLVAQTMTVCFHALRESELSRPLTIHQPGGRVGLGPGGCWLVRWSSSAEEDRSGLKRSMSANDQIRSGKSAACQWLDLNRGQGGAARDGEALSTCRLLLLLGGYLPSPGTCPCPCPVALWPCTFTAQHGYIVLSRQRTEI